MGGYDGPHEGWCSKCGEGEDACKCLPAPLAVRLNPVVSASEVIMQIMLHTEEVSKSHPPGSWSREGMLRHVHHVIQHAQNLLDVIQEPDYYPYNFNEELDHLLCRAAMAVWCRKRGLDGDYGEEGSGVR